MNNEILSKCKIIRKAISTYDKYTLYKSILNLAESLLKYDREDLSDDLQLSRFQLSKCERKIKSSISSKEDINYNKIIAGLLSKITEIEGFARRENLEIDKQEKKHNRKASNFWNWLNSEKKYLNLWWISFLSLIPGTFVLFFRPDFFSVYFSIANLLFSIFAFYFIGKDGKKMTTEVDKTSFLFTQNKEFKLIPFFKNPSDQLLFSKVHTNELLDQFRDWWKGLWGAWILFYTWKSFYHLYISPINHNHKISLDNADYIITSLLQNFGNTFFVILFLAMCLRSISITGTYNKYKHRFESDSIFIDKNYSTYPFQFWKKFFLIIAFIIPAIYSMNLIFFDGTFSIISKILSIATGVFGGIGMSLFIGRIIDNDFIDKNKWILISTVFLYLYAIIRTFYPILYTCAFNISSEQNALYTSLLIMAAFPLKIILYYLFKWLYASGRLVFLIWQELLWDINDKREDNFNFFLNEVEKDVTKK